jgi:hypothetical protein
LTPRRTAAAAAASVRYQAQVQRQSLEIPSHYYYYYHDPRYLDEDRDSNGSPRSATPGAGTSASSNSYRRSCWGPPSQEESSTHGWSVLLI